ncbi:Muskelin [Carpediemonas membranifera]|uniref:Muskelin n=1 Tax=Carpediemonas membranifera TaxID=201153 RepID=A0A8J6AV06_9EUKA|nr:Muskelin [Carpediemonas membranifera]|eukprot:KAG9392265.1 Muskelin [Carpediemonas membranifera]
MDLTGATSLQYSVHSYSSQEHMFGPETLGVTDPTDALSKWSCSARAGPQYVLLELKRIAILTRIAIGKYERRHPSQCCDFRVYAGLSRTSLTPILTHSLRNNTTPEAFDLLPSPYIKKTPSPVRYVKIELQTAHVSNESISLAFVGLTGVELPTPPSAIHSNVYSRTTARQILSMCTNERAVPIAGQLLKMSCPKFFGDLFDHIISGSDNLEDFIFENWSHFIPGDSRIPPVLAADRLPPSENTPHSRSGHHMITMPSGKILLHGGWSGTRDLADTHLYDPSTNTWLEANDDSPGPRSWHSMACDSKGNIYMLGRFDDSHGSRCDLWRYKSGIWSCICNDCSAQGGPVLVRECVLTFVESCNSLYVAGGLECRSNQNEPYRIGSSYIYDIDDDRWTAVSISSVSTLHRTGASAFYDAQTNCSIVIGGLTTDDEQLRDVVAIKHGEGHSPRVISRAPLSLGRHRSAFDRTSRLVYISVPGHSDCGMAIWCLSLNTLQWTQLVPGNTADTARIPPFVELMNRPAPGLKLPNARTDHQMVYHPGTKALYIYGGVMPGLSRKERLNDVWRVKIDFVGSPQYARTIRAAIRRQKYVEACIVTPHQMSNLEMLRHTLMTPDTRLTDAAIVALSGMAARNVTIGDIQRIYPFSVLGMPDLLITSRLALFECLLYYLDDAE